jgi:hypothetical protein
MSVSTQSLKDRLRSSVRHGLTFFPVETFPERLREQFSEIKSALTGVDPIDSMKSAEVRRLIRKVISLRDV